MSIINNAEQSRSINQDILSRKDVHLLKIKLQEILNCGFACFIHLRVVFLYAVLSEFEQILLQVAEFAKETAYRAVLLHITFPFKCVCKATHQRVCQNSFH